MKSYLIKSRIKILLRFLLPVIILFLFIHCSSTKTRIDQKQKITGFIKSGEFEKAVTQIEMDRSSNKYTKKDRVLYYLDKGIVNHYQDLHNESNKSLEQADWAMEELFTKSISRAALSLLINDNVLEYHGEVHENLYVNIFKALNYLNMNDFDGAFVEVRRVNDKLRELEDKYGRMIDNLNSIDTIEVNFEKRSENFYSDALAHYVSFLMFRADGDFDNARISYQMMRTAWLSQPEIYYFPMPDHLKREPEYRGNFLNIFAFSGTAPRKHAVGGKITTYDNLVHLSDLSGYKENVFLPFPGIKQGYHFKFSFPEMRREPSKIKRIELIINNKRSVDLELFEDMNRIAIQSFQTHKDIIYLKTVIRTVLKGLASAKAKKKLRKKTGVEKNRLLGAILNFGVDMAVDATENPDLRSWITMPGYCYTTEIEIEPGLYNMEIRFYNDNNLLLERTPFTNYQVISGLNIVEAACLN